VSPLQLKSIDRKDYKQPLSDAQMASLKALFPQGVCDYGKKGVAQRSPDTWLTYPAPGTSMSLDQNSRSSTN
jgi:hypothetical protein